MKNYPITTFLCLLALAIPSAADTFIMKDGSKLQGRIVSEDATTYLLEVEFAKASRTNARSPRRMSLGSTVKNPCRTISRPSAPCFRFPI